MRTFMQMFMRMRMSCKTTDMLKLNSMLLTIDIQKTFDSVNHQFLILALKKYELEKCALNG